MIHSDLCVAKMLTSGLKEPVHSVSFGTVNYVCVWSVSLSFCCVFYGLKGVASDSKYLGDGALESELIVNLS